MKNIILIIAGALAGLILFQFLFYSCEKKKLNKEIASVKEQLDICLNAPIKSDTVVVTKTLKDTIYLTYTHKVTDTVHESEAIDWINQTIEQRTYSGTYTHPQFDLDWSALVTGTLDNLTINPPSSIKNLQITDTKTVDLTEYQTPTNKERSHLYANMGGYFGSSQGIDVGLAYIRRSNWGIRASIGTDFEGLTYHAGLLIKLK